MPETEAPNPSIQPNAEGLEPTSANPQLVDHHHRILALGAAGLLLAGAGAKVLSKVRHMRQEHHSSTASDLLTEAVISETDDQSGSYFTQMKGIEGALQNDSLPDDDRSTLSEVFEVMQAQKREGILKKIPSVGNIARRLVRNAPDIRSIITSLTHLRVWRRESETTEIYSPLSDGQGTQDALMLRRVAEGIDTLDHRLRPSVQIEMRKKLKENGHRVVRPNKVEWARIGEIARQRWPSPSLREARHAIQGHEAISPETVMYPNGWLIHKSPSGKILGYATFFPVKRIDITSESDREELSSLSLDSSLTQRTSSLAGNTMLVTAIQQSPEARTPDATAALFFALQEVAHMSGAENVLSASLSHYPKLKQMRDVRAGTQPRSYQELWADDDWNNTISAFAQIPDDIGFSPEFMDVTLPEDEVEALIALQHRQPVESITGGTHQIYLDSLPVPLEVGNGYHVRLPAAFKVLYQRDGSYLAEASLPDRLAMSLYAGITPEPEKPKDHSNAVPV